LVTSQPAFYCVKAKNEYNGGDDETSQPCEAVEQLAEAGHTQALLIHPRAWRVDTDAALQAVGRIEGMREEDIIGDGSRGAIAIST